MQNLDQSWKQTYFSWSKYFSARINDSGNSESDKHDQNEDECTDDGDSQASPTDLESMTDVRELDKLR